ncbi:hypothetical protein Tco_0649230 [Tanacetum coccineum]
MYNDIMAAGSRELPPILATGRYAQWQSRFMRYIDTRPNTTATEEVVHAHTITETYKYTTPKKRAYFDAKDEAIHLILTGTGDDIYFTFDACTTAKEMRIAIERLQQGESLNKQDVKTNHFWEFGDWLDDTDEEPNEQELEAHCLYMAKIQEVSTAESGPTFDAEPLEKVHTNNEYNVFENDQEHTDQPKNINDTPLMETIDSNTIPDSLDVCDNDFKDDQNANDQEDERVALANLISNLKLNTDENKKIQ